MMFTGGGRKKQTNNGQSNNSSQRSRNRSHQEVCANIYVGSKYIKSIFIYFLFNNKRVVKKVVDMYRIGIHHHHHHQRLLEVIIQTIHIHHRQAVPLQNLCRKVH